MKYKIGCVLMSGKRSKQVRGCVTESTYAPPGLAVISDFNLIMSKTIMYRALETTVYTKSPSQYYQKQAKNTRKVN